MRWANHARVQWSTTRTLVFPRLSLQSSISHTIWMYDMPRVRIRTDWPGESRLGRLAMDLASPVSVPLSAVSLQISRLVLESLKALARHPSIGSEPPAVQLIPHFSFPSG